MLNRLYEIVHSLNLERIERELLIRRQKDRRRNSISATRREYATQNVEAGESRHLDVEEQKIHRLPLEHPDRLLTIAALGHDALSSIRLQQLTNAATSNRLVAHDCGAHKLCM